MLAIITPGYQRMSLSKPLDDHQLELSSHLPPICPRQIRSACSEKRAIAVFQPQSNKVGASVETALGFCVALSLVYRVEFDSTYQIS